MTTGSGIDGQMGLVSESEYGTAVTVSRFHEVASGSITPDTVKVEPKLVARGLYQRSDRSRTVVVGGNGKMSTIALTKGDGVLFKHMLGSVATAQVGATDEYKHTFTPDTANGMRGLSATVQVGLPFVNGTVQAFTGVGGKVPSWKLSAAIDDVLKIEMDWLFRNVVTNIALASEAYPTTAEMFVFDEIAVVMEGDPVNVGNIEISAANSLVDNRRYLGSALRAEPLANDIWVINGKVGKEWEDLDAYDAWVAGTPASVVMTATGPIIPEESNPFKLVVTLAEIKFDGSVAELSGPGILTHDVPFTALSNGTDPVIKFEYHTTDTTP